MAREVWITGIGLISSLGEGTDATWAALQDGGLKPEWSDHEALSPFHVHPIRDLDVAKHIPKRGDQRAMGPFMHYGACAAGMALQQAGIAGEEKLLSETHLIVGCGGGERDEGADETILKALDKTNDKTAGLNELLLNELRPTLFLAQLPNLFAGNISIVHGVTGSSRTFMGEESAGVDATRIAFERVQADQGDLFLVGSAFNGERKDILAIYKPGGMVAEGPLAPFWERPQHGMCLGSLGVFLVIEAASHAKARGAVPIAKISQILSDRTNRQSGSAAATAEKQWSNIRSSVHDAPLGVLSGACGAGNLAKEELQFLETLGPKARVRGTAAAWGHGIEAAFPANIALAAIAAQHHMLFPPLSAEQPLERPSGTEPVSQFLVTQWGHQRGEALALVESVDQ